MRISLRTRLFLTIGVTCIVVGLAVSWASRRAATEGFRVLFESSEAFDPGTLELHEDPLAAEIPHEARGSLHKEVSRSFDRDLMSAIALIAIAAMLATFLLTRWIVGPIERLTAMARTIGQGDLRPSAGLARNDELGELARTLTTLATDLAETESLRRNLVDDVAHELRTPLTAMRGQVEALQDGLLKPTQKTLKVLHSNVMHLGVIVDDLQELALAEAGQLAMHLADVDLASVVRDLIASLQGADGEPSIEIDLPPMPLVRADAGRTRQILSNLISNARRHSPTDTPIRITGLVTPGRVEIRVIDQGAGLSAADIERVFERFYRVDSSRERGTGGVGLGLAIARRLAEAQGGELSLLSEPGSGVTAIVSFERTA